MVLPLGFAENSIQLVPDGTLLLHVIIILVMVYVLNATLLKPINRILEGRDRRTKGRRDEAQQILNRVSETIARYEQSIRQAKGKGYAFAESERTAAMQERQQRVNEVRQQMSERVAQEKAAIRSQAEEARGTLEYEARTRAAEIGSRVLNRSVSG